MQPCPAGVTAAALRMEVATAAPPLSGPVHTRWSTGSRNPDAAAPTGDTLGGVVEAVVAEELESPRPKDCSPRSGDLAGLIIRRANFVHAVHLGQRGVKGIGRHLGSDPQRAAQAIKRGARPLGASATESSVCVMLQLKASTPCFSSKRLEGQGRKRPGSAVQTWSNRVNATRMDPSSKQPHTAKR